MHRVDEGMSKKFLLSFISLVVCLLVLELTLRIHFHLQDPIIQARKTSVEYKKGYGWDLRPLHEYKIADSGFYKVNDLGFRFFSSVHDQARKTVLLIGDSFTHAPEMANEDVYYSALSKLNVNFYSYGVVGWNNLQELMKVEEYVELIKPDIVIWQLSANDLIENVFEIEKRLGKKSFGRPYYDEESKIFYDKDKSLLTRIRVILKDSRAVNFIFDRVHSLINLPSEEITITDEERKKARLITKFVFKRMREILQPRSQIVSFNAGPLPFESFFFYELALSEGHIYIHDIENQINKAKTDKLDIFTSDMFHWNKSGHLKISKILTPKIEALINAEKVE